MDAILNQIENDLPVVNTTFYIALACFAIGVTAVWAIFSRPNFINRNEGLHVLLFFTGLFGSIICAVAASDYWVSTDSGLACVAENEICHSTPYVHHKAIFESYTDYTITSGRFNRIYARIQKFPELKENIYAVQLGDKIGIIKDKYAQTAINETINRYELYRK